MKVFRIVNPPAWFMAVLASLLHGLRRLSNLKRFLIVGLFATYGVSLSATPPPGEWIQTFNEDFDGTSLNTQIWRRGYINSTVLNGERQAYRPENISVANGVCSLLVEKRTANNLSMLGIPDAVQSYCSGAITTFDTWTQMYGYFEARIKFPRTPQTWPAFWLLPDRGPSYTSIYGRTAIGTMSKGANKTDPADDIYGLPMGNEIDIFEHMANWVNASTDMSLSHHGFFYGDYGTGSSYGGFGKVDDGSGEEGYLYPIADGSFHTYGLYWSPTELRFYIDGELTLRTTDLDHVGATPHYMILNCAITLNDWVNPPPDNQQEVNAALAELDAELPATMEIDYVRAWTGTASTEYYEIENLAVADASDAIVVFEDDLAGSGYALKLSSNAVGDYIAYTVPVYEAGSYFITVRYKKHETRGKFQLSIDSVNLGSEVDEYSATSEWEETTFGPITFTVAGNKEFRFTVTGKNESSSGRDLVFDYIKLEPSTPSTDITPYVPPNYITLDTESATGVTLYGDWTTSSSSYGFLGLHYRHDNNSGKGDKYVEYVPDLSSGGPYEIQMRWPSGSNRANNVPVDIMEADSSTTTVTIDQTVGNGAWISIGEYNLSPSNASVTIQTTNTNGYVMADGVRFIPQVSSGVEQIFEVESIMDATATDSTTIFSDTAASNGSGEKLNANAVGDYIDYAVPLSTAGTYVVKVGQKTFGTRGQYQLAIDSVDQGSVQEQYAYNGSYEEVNLGQRTFSSVGSTSFRFTVTGKSSSSSGYDLAFDYIKLSPSGGSEATEVTMDSEDSSGITLTGSWPSSSSVSGYLGGNYLHDGSTDKGNKSVTYTPQLTAAGDYEVFLRWTVAYNRATDVPVEIVQANGTTASTSVDQSANNGVWVSLGTYSLSPSNAAVTILTTGTDGYAVIADGVRLTPQ